MDQPTAQPTNKVIAATIGAAAATIIVYAVEVAASVDLPATVEGAITVLFVFGAGYVIRD